MTSTVPPPKHHTAFSFPLCYATSDASSSSETTTSGGVLKPAWEASSGGGSTEGCDLDADISESSSTYLGGSSNSQVLCKEALLLVPPPTFASSVLSTGLPDNPTTHASVTTRELGKDHFMSTLRYMESQVPQGVAHSAPAALALASSRGTSVTSSFSSESVPVVTTSQGSTDRNDSSCIASGVTDRDAFPLSEECHKEGSPVHSVSFKQKAHQAKLYSSGGTQQEAVARCDTLGDDNLTNNSELTLSLESVLTVVPQALGEYSSSQGKSDSDKRRQHVDSFPLRKLPPDASIYAHGPRHSTSSFGDASLQSWDSHLEVDQAIEDIVESVIQDLSIYEADIKSHSGTFSQEDSMAGDLPRKASPTSMSSYASSKRLEWDNGADIGYSDSHSKSQLPERMGGLQVLSHHGNGYPYAHLHGPKSKGDSLQGAMFFGGTAPTPAFRDVVVQTEVCPIKDAEVQASVANGFEDTRPETILKEPLTRLSSSVSSSANADADASSSSTKCGCTLSVSSEKSKCTSIRRMGHISSAVGAGGASNHNSSSISHSPTMESPDRLSIHGSNVAPPRDCARCVSLSFSHKSFRDSSSCHRDKSLTSKSAATHAVAQKSGTIDSTSELAKNATPIKWTPDKDSLCSDIGNLGVVKANRLKMRLPNAVRRLASRSNTPVEAPRACSELNKRRLDYWLSSGFPYIPAVALLETDMLPHITTTEPSAGSKDMLTDQLTVLGSNLPLISCERRPLHMKPKQTDIKLQAPTGSTLTRKRYITRPLPLSNAQVTSQAVTAPAVATITSRHFATRDKQRFFQKSAGPFAADERGMCCEGHPVTEARLKAVVDGKASTGRSESSSSELSAKPVKARARRGLAITRRSRNLCARYTSTSYDTTSEEVPSEPLAVSGTSCKLKRIARKELEKLRGLVDRQRNSYLRQLQKEVERLHRLRELFLLAEDKRPTSSETTTVASDSVEASLEERISTNDDNYSVGVQTSSSLLGSEQERAATERYFVSMGTTAAKKKQRAGLSPFNKRSRTIRPGVAWVVPLETAQCPRNLPGEAPAKREHVQADEDLSLQAAFAARCGHLIQRFQARQLQVATLAKHRQHHQQPPLLMHFVTKNHEQVQQRAFRGLKQPRRTFSHREMRDHTEKVYQKLPEVVDKNKKVHREQQYRTNRLMAQVYNKAIQEKALKGHVNFAINRPSARV